MNNHLVKHREKIQTLLSEPSVFPHQRNAARNTYQALQGETRAVIMAAEMHENMQLLNLMPAARCYSLLARYLTVSISTPSKCRSIQWDQSY